MPDQVNILRLDATGRHGGSVSRPLADRLIDGIRARAGESRVTERDLTAEPLPVVDDAWVAAAYAKDGEDVAGNREILKVSDALVDEFAAADVIVVTAPIYNFTVPAQLKLWIDQVARIGRTFIYTEQGPVPTLPDRLTYVIVASGGTPIGSEIDFATGYLRHVLGFLGLRDVQFVAADRLIFEGEAKVEAARTRIDELAAAFRPGRDGYGVRASAA